MENLEQILLDLQEFGTYRASKGALQVLNPSTGKYEDVKTFTKRTIPQLDAAIFVGGYPRFMIGAAECMIVHHNLYDADPEPLFVGNKSPRGQIFTCEDTTFCKGTEAMMYEELMLAFGFHQDWVFRNHYPADSLNTAQNIAEIEMLLRDLFPGNRAKVGVFTEAGYSLRLAQELCFALPRHEFLFHEPEITPLEDRTFCVEKLIGGYWADITIASVYHAINEKKWDIERLPLPGCYHSQFKKLRRTIAQIAESAYVFYLYPDNLQDLGFDDEWIALAKEQRQIEILGLNNAGEKVGEMLPLLDPLKKDDPGWEMVENAWSKWEEIGLCEGLIKTKSAPIWSAKS